MSASKPSAIDSVSELISNLDTYDLIRSCTAPLPRTVVV